jgi:hypothetical protein
MKKVVTVTEVDNEGLDGLMGQVITVWCLNYIYTGKLEGINDDYIKLVEASVVYETGAFTEKNWKDAQRLPNPCYVMKRCIESFMVLK